MRDVKTAATLFGLLASTALALIWPCSGFAETAYPTVTDQRLLNAQSDDGWLMYRRAYNGQGFAPFEQITPENVQMLKETFSCKTGLYRWA